jgi:hypothetical protein
MKIVQFERTEVVYLFSLYLTHDHNNRYPDRTTTNLL